MINYNISAAYELNNFNYTLYKMICFRITIFGSKFRYMAYPTFVRVSDGTHTVFAFFAYETGNLKEIVAGFTVDAFDNFTGNVKVEFGYGPIVIETFENIDLSILIEPLPSIASDVSAPVADNAWLATLNV